MATSSGETQQAAELTKQTSETEAVVVIDDTRSTSAAGLELLAAAADADKDNDDMAMCQYGINCYRRNPDHFKLFKHPPGHKIGGRRPIVQVKSESSTQSSSSSPIAPKSARLSSFSQQRQASQGLFDKGGFFLSRVAGLSPEHNARACHLRDLLSLNSQNLMASAHFNFMIDVSWLLRQYPTNCRSKPITLVVGENGGTGYDELKAECDNYPNIQVAKARLFIPFGTHHTKMSILKYRDGLRIIIGTANLIEQDWNLKTQGIYVTPLCPQMVSYDEPVDRSMGDSSTNFKSELLTYLDMYTKMQAKSRYLYGPETGLLKDWSREIMYHDLSKINVHLVGSVPGRFTGSEMENWGHLKLRKLLLEQNMDQSWPLIAQCSSIGSLGTKPDAWLTGQFLTSLAGLNGPTTRRPRMSFVYPTVSNVRESLEGYAGGASLPYRGDTANKQRYLNVIMHQWRSERLGRTRALPHIKSYARVSPDWKKLGWYLLTSANLSKAAWGELQKNDTQLQCRSYELGVLITSNDEEEMLSIEQLLSYDLPLTSYGPYDKPWVVDCDYDIEDSLGCTWNPS